MAKAPAGGGDDADRIVDKAPLGGEQVECPHLAHQPLPLRQMPPFRYPTQFNANVLATPMKTESAKLATTRSGWYLVNADGLILGRLATEIARRLKGKHKPDYTPHVATGDHVVVVNAERVRVTGRKRKQKTYHRHTGYIGNMKSVTFEKQVEKDARRVIEHAVRGMLPKNPLGRAMYRRLRVYSGPEHPHVAQQPEELKF